MTMPILMGVFFVEETFMFRKKCALFIAVYVSALFLLSTNICLGKDHYHSYDLGNVLVGSTVETEVEVCIDASKIFAYVYVGFGETDTESIYLEKVHGPYYMGQLIYWYDTTLLAGSKCRKSSVFFKPTSEGTYTARVVGQVRSGGNDGYSRNDIHDFTAKAVMNVNSLNWLPAVTYLIMN